MKRPLSERVAGENQDLFMEIPYGEREIAGNPIQHAFPPFHPGAKQQIRVAMLRRERRPQIEISFQLVAIVEPEVRDQQPSFPGIDERLPVEGILRENAVEAAAERDRRESLDPLVVGAITELRVIHAGAGKTYVWRPAPDDAGYGAHSMQRWNRRAAFNL
ncbi:MAG TPA: hypothetical protein VH331_12435 [Allosphingosinicella sp.]|nr:hypothetical protein [Allosphingosinicella sp.]